MAGNYDLYIKQGETLQRNITWKDASGVVIDTSTYTAALLKVRITPDDPTVQATLSKANGLITLGIQGTAPNQFNVQLFVPAATTAAYTAWGKGYYDLLMTDVAGTVTCLLQGAAVLVPEVSY